MWPNSVFVPKNNKQGIRGEMKIVFYCSDFDEDIFAYVADDSKHKKMLSKKIFYLNVFRQSSFCQHFFFAYACMQKNWTFLKGGVSAFR